MGKKVRKEGGVGAKGGVDLTDSLTDSAVP